MRNHPAEVRGSKLTMNGTSFFWTDIGIQVLVCIASLGLFNWNWPLIVVEEVYMRVI